MQHEDFEILSVARHHKKLRRGIHSGNKFRLVLREFAALQSHWPAIEARLEEIAGNGVPNYFGEQRFGHDGGNLVEAQSLIERDQLKGNRRGSGMILPQLARGCSTWCWLSVFVAIPGPLQWNLRLSPVGRSGVVVDPPPGAIWQNWSRGCSPGWQSWCYALEHAGLKQERRATVLVPELLQWKLLQADQLSYLFACLREAMPL